MEAAVTAHGGSDCHQHPQMTEITAGDSDRAQHTRSRACIKTEMCLWLFVQLCVSIFLRMLFYFYTLNDRPPSFQILSNLSLPNLFALPHLTTKLRTDYNTKTTCAYNKHVISSDLCCCYDTRVQSVTATLC